MPSRVDDTAGSGDASKSMIPLTPTLCGENLSCLRGDRLVFAALGFAVAAGGALLLRGANGSGKTSLLRMVAGLLPPLDGRLLWGDAPIVDDPAAHRRRIGYLGHADGVKAQFTTLEMVSLAARLADPRQARPRADQALADLGIAALAPVPGRYLSAGQRRRVALAGLLAKGARVWLLDEPTVGLDARAEAALDRIVARHRNEGGLVIAATHRPLDWPGAETLAVDRFAPTAGAAA